MISGALGVLETVLESERTCVLATCTKIWPVHVAIMHYSYKFSPIELFFSTDLNSVKCEKLRVNEEIQGAGKKGVHIGA